MAISDEHKITRQGKTLVLYAGLLNEAHEKGLRSIETELLQVPTEANGNVAIVKARATLEDGRTFDGIGDASPANVGRNIAPHIIRQSETRAKARALRDAINLAEALSDDPAAGEEEEPALPRPVPDEAMRGAAREQAASTRVNRSDSPASEPQLRYIKKLTDELFDGDEGALADEFGVSLETVTVSEASSIIEELNRRKREGA